MIQCHDSHSTKKRSAQDRRHCEKRESEFAENNGERRGLVRRRGMCDCIKTTVKSMI
jgi:hypothetical protein